MYLLLSIMFGLIMFFIVPPVSYAACGPSGNESPNNPGWCYTRASVQGGCVVVNCESYGISIHSTFRVEGNSQTNDQFTLTETDKDPSVIDEDLASFDIVPNENGVIDDDLISFKTTSNNGNGVIDEDPTSFFGTLFNPIRNFFVTITNNVRQFSQRNDLPHSRSDGGGILKSYRDSDDDGDGVIDDDLISFNVTQDSEGWIEEDLVSFKVGGNDGNVDPVDGNLTSFRYGDTQCDITISAILTQIQKNQIIQCVNDPTLSISSDQKSVILKMINK